MIMKKAFVWMLLVCLALTSCAFAEPESSATLYVVAYGEEEGQYPLAYTGELTGEALLDGLSALTQHNFAYERVEVEGDAVTVVWADDASFMPGANPPVEVESLGLIFYDVESTLQFMLDSARATLVNNLGVSTVYYATAAGDGLSFPDVTDWALPAGEAYSGDFDAYYPQDFTFVDQREVRGDPGENIGPTDAAQIAYDVLVAGQETGGAPWQIILKDIVIVENSEGYAFSIGQGEGDAYEERYDAVVTYAGGLYTREDGAQEYALVCNWQVG